MPIVLIFGGSQGAQKINEAIIGMIEEKMNKNYQIIWATGPKQYENIKNELANKNIDIENVEDIYWKLSFFIVYDRRIILDELVNELNNSKNIISVDYLH